MSVLDKNIGQLMFNLHLFLVTPFLNIRNLLLYSFSTNPSECTLRPLEATYISFSMNSNLPSTASTASVLSCFNSTGPTSLYILASSFSDANSCTALASILLYSRLATYFLNSFILLLLAFQLLSGLDACLKL